MKLNFSETGEDSKEFEFCARHMSKYVFPLQYNLKSVFGTENVKNEQFERWKFVDREQEISVRPFF